MRLQRGLVWGAFLAVAVGMAGALDADENNGPRLRVGQFNPDHESVEMFAAMDTGQIDVKFIAQDATAARVLIENKTKQPLNVKLPEAFAGVPADVLAQFGGGGAGGGGFGGGGMGGGQQGMGGGMGGMGGGGGQQGGGFFNVAPEKVGKLKVACVCLDHGKPDPTPRNNYKIVKIERYVKNPETIELMKLFGTGKIDHGTAQAATWHLNNGLTWQELATMPSGEKRLIGSPRPYFHPAQVRLAVELAKHVREQVRKSDSPTESVSQN